MPKCPQCNKPFDNLPRRCPTCQTDLDLLVEYVSGLRSGLEQADRLTRSGELGQAVWTYLSVLEVDPDNAVAQRQVGQVTTAVRQFDRTSPMRRWIGQQRGEIPTEEQASRRLWLWLALTVLLTITGFGGGYLLGAWSASAVEMPAVPVMPHADDTPADPPPPLRQPADRPITG